MRHGACPGQQSLHTGGSRTHDPPVVELGAAVGGGQDGAAHLQVPGPLALLRGAGDGDGVDAVGVAVAGAVVRLLAAVPRRPHEDGAEPLATLGCAERESDQNKNKKETQRDGAAAGFACEDTSLNVILWSDG